MEPGSSRVPPGRHSQAIAKENESIEVGVNAFCSVGYGYQPVAAQVGRSSDQVAVAGPKTETIVTQLTITNLQQQKPTATQQHNNTTTAQQRNSTVTVRL